MPWHIRNPWASVDIRRSVLVATAGLVVGSYAYDRTGPRDAATAHERLRADTQTLASELGASAPRRSDSGGMVTRYDDIQTALHDPARFSSRRSVPRTHEVCPPEIADILTGTVPYGRLVLIGTRRSTRCCAPSRTGRSVSGGSRAPPAHPGDGRRACRACDSRGDFTATYRPQFFFRGLQRLDVVWDG